MDKQVKFMIKAFRKTDHMIDADIKIEDVKILIAYRDKSGKFTSSSTGRKVYAEEFVVIGKKMRE